MWVFLTIFQLAPIPIAGVAIPVEISIQDQLCSGRNLIIAKLARDQESATVGATGCRRTIRYAVRTSTPAPIIATE